MPIIPSEREDEYFTRQEMERRRKVAEEHQARLQQEEREQARALHFMKCPKCGMQLEEIEFGGVHVDKCFACEGVWLDKGELETVQSKEPGFVKRLFGVFK